MSIKVGENYLDYSTEYLEKVQSRQGTVKGMENRVNDNSIPVPKDEYISSEKSGNKPSGLYRMGQDENGNPKILYDDPKKAEKKSAKASKNTAKKENFFVRMWKKLVKLCKDTVGEMKKVVWTPKSELAKNTKLVIATVVIISVVIAIIDLSCSFIINSIAGFIG